MGVTGKINQWAGNLQAGIKTSSVSIVNVVVKLFSAFVIGLTFSIVGDALLHYGTFSHLLVIMVTIAVVLRLMKDWTLARVLIFDLFCILLALLLRMYIVIAP